MGWKPVHEAHAIDRVRVLIEFSSPLSEKQLNKFTAPITEKFRDFGFDQIARAESTFQNIVIPPVGAGPITQQVQNGWVLKRAASKQLVEEVGFRDGVFGYMSTEYGRWENLASRFWDIFEHALSAAIGAVDVNLIKLEYWDKFLFAGAPTDANLSELLANIDPAIPLEVLSGASLWHSHVGWFENHQNSMVLINRNFDVVDEHLADQVRRACNIFTLVELRQPREVSSTRDVREILEHLHKKSLFLFGTSISEDQRANIGLNLEDYRI